MNLHRVQGRLCSHQSGFTLLEAIVTLVIVSLLVTVLMQALGQAMNLRTRLLRFEGESRRAVLQEAWFRESVAAMQRGYDVQDGRQLGDATHLDYVTPAPLVARGFSRVHWWVEQGALHYSDAAVSNVVVVPGPLRDAGFAYLDASGVWRHQWAWSDHKGMPRLVRFTARTERGLVDWLVPIQSVGPDPDTLRLGMAGSNGI